MSLAPLIADGTYRARARAVKHSQTADGIPFIEVDLDVFRSPNSAKLGINSVRISWRGWKTRGSAKRTISSLQAMGATFAEDDPNELEGVGLTECEAEVISIECDDREAPGRWRTFVLKVRPIDEGRRGSTCERPDARRGDR